MEKDRIQSWFTGKNLVLVLVGVMIVYLSTTLMIDKRFAVIEENIQNEVNQQQITLAAIAEAMSRSGGDDVIESVITDCEPAERNQFNILLSSLDLGLSNQQLTELERLFGRCGSFSSDRKSIMSSRLAREILVYEAYVKHLSLVKDRDLIEQYNVELWKALAVEENNQSNLFSQLVDLQDEIIQELLDGNSATSPEILAILDEVKEVRENLQLAITMASQIRNDITSI